MDDALWKDALEKLRSRVSAENFDTWFEPIEFAGMLGQTLSLRIPNRFHADWLNAHYLESILESLPASAGAEKTLGVQWLVDEKLQARLRPSRPTSSSNGTVSNGTVSRPAAKSLRLSPERAVASQQSEAPADLHPKYHFDDFIVGPSNQLAHAAAIAVCREPGGRYNPLFVYGGVGLGKTHLLNAIGHRLQRQDTTRCIHYVSAERFTNEFISALRNHHIDAFRQRYRQDCNVLLMDDIQFLAGREQTQEEFFHTFNALHLAGRQIVVTSDVGPQRIAEMQERLISRFQSGMIADTQPPELDTRIAILQKKAEQEKIHLPHDVALAIAQRITSNVRELEGTLLRVAVQSELMHRSLDVAAVENLLAEQQPLPSQAESFEDIQRVVCEHFRLRLSDLKSSRRARTITFPRMVAMFLCRRRLQASYPEIGEHFGGKDHTTVIHAVRKINTMVDQDSTTRATLETLQRKLSL